MIQVFYIPFDDDLDIFDEPDGLLAVSGMCVNSALKKLYSCSIIPENKKKKNDRPLMCNIYYMKCEWTYKMKIYSCVDP